MPPTKTSILKKILIPILLVMIFQVALLYGVLIFGGTLAQLRENSFDIFSEKVSGRRDQMQNEMIQRWSNLEESVETVLDETTTFLNAQDLTAREMLADHRQTTCFLSELAPELLYLLRKNSVGGAFIILDEADPTQKSGLYFRDPDPDSNPADYSDLQVERAPSAITKALGIPLGSNWTPRFNLETGETSYFYKPMQAASEHPEVGYRDLGYWSKHFYLSGEKCDATQIITYSVPLIYEGKPIGVLGVELSVSYLEKHLPESELGNENAEAGFVLCTTDDASGQYAPVVRSGALFNRIMPQSDEYQLKPYGRSEDFFRVEGTEAADRVIACVAPLRLYNTHTVFENEQWLLMGMSYEDDLLGFTKRFQVAVLGTCGLSLLVGILVTLLVSRKITRPVRLLSRRVQEADPSHPILLPRLDIAEIDELSASIEYLSAEVINASGKLSQILRMTDISIGAFEYNEKGEGKIFLSDHFFSVLNGIPEDRSDCYTDTATFKQQMAKILDQAAEELREKNDTELTLRFERGGAPYWARLKLVFEAGHVLGVATNITQEMLEKRRMEHDRDYDFLTNLYNRRAFQTGINELLSSPEKLQTAALIMMDLDNLKFINDTYGHDLGDEYIRSAAVALKKAVGAAGLVARLSGDEFVAFLYGFADRAGIRRICDGIQAELQHTMIMLPDGSCVPVRASAGLAWYPDDATNVEDLVRYADFAMYMVKRTNKGQFTDFNMESYHRDSYLLHGKEELNLILERGLIDYHFQPIFDAKTGEIFGFEALMRPNSETIRTPLELLSLARSQSKLALVEHLSFFRSLECYRLLDISNGTTKLFVNSLPTQILSEEDLTRFETRFRPYLHQLVIEITEEERSEEGLTQRKMAAIHSWGAALALDDFGAGYNGETALVEMSPQYIKLDISIVKNIHADKNRFQVLENLLSYSHDRGIKVIAEGVELEADMQVLIHAGVDYLQGFFLAMPSLYPQTKYPVSAAAIRAVHQEHAAAETV